MNRYGGHPINEAQGGSGLLEANPDTNADTNADRIIPEYAHGRISQHGWEAVSIHHEPSTSGYVVFIAKADDGTDEPERDIDDD